VASRRARGRLRRAPGARLSRCVRAAAEVDDCVPGRELYYFSVGNRF
jgi:hypothetical protein